MIWAVFVPSMYAYGTRWLLLLRKQPTTWIALCLALVFTLCAASISATAQTNEWTWMGGSSSTTGSIPGVYGTLGVAAAGNIPGRREGAVTWTDSSGHLWLFGGDGYDANGNFGQLYDLWEFNPSLGTYGEWTWMGGSSTLGSYGGQKGVYGTLGVPAVANFPGGRYAALSWTDSSGKFWLSDGNEYGGTSAIYFNDLWKYTTPTPVATPTFSPAGGSYGPSQTVTINDATPGAKIYYTTNGTTPTISSSVYSSPITVSATETVEAIAVKANWINSAVGSATYTIHGLVATPTFSPGTGSYGPAQTVTISTTTSSATIYYTTNGTTPTTSSTVYSGPITVATTETVQAIAAEAGWTNSAVNTAAYLIIGPGHIASQAGNGVLGYSGDGGPAASAEFSYPTGVAADSSGNLYIVDADNNRIRKVTASTGIITTVAGNGTAGSSGDGGAATSAELSYPTAVVVDSPGNVYIADYNNNKVRTVGSISQ